MLNNENGLEAGTHGFIISADGRTFNRTKRFNIEVQWLVEVIIESATKPGKNKVRIKLREEYFIPSSLLPGVILMAPDKNKRKLELTRIKDSWLGKIEVGQDGVYRVLVQIEASSVAGEVLRLDLIPFPYHWAD